MNILMIGASGTGKTTIAEGIAKYYEENGYKVQIAPSIGRSVLSNVDRSINGSFVVEEQALEGHKHNFETLLTEDENTVSIFPRSAADVIAYLMAKKKEIEEPYMVVGKKGTLELSEKIPEETKKLLEEVEELIQKALEELYDEQEACDLCIYVPKTFETVDDGVRSSKEEVDKLVGIYGNIFAKLESFGIPMIAVPKGSIEEKNEFVIRKIYNIMNDIPEEQEEIFKKPEE